MEHSVVNCSSPVRCFLGAVCPGAKPWKSPRHLSRASVECSACNPDLIFDLETCYLCYSQRMSIFSTLMPKKVLPLLRNPQVFLTKTSRLF